jgi:hypothetical protein
MCWAWSCRTARDNHPTDAPPDERGAP